MEAGGVIDLARTVAAANGFDGRIVALSGFSTALELPEKVDVAITDQAGTFGYNAGVVEFFEDARRRFLKPSGTTIPSALELFLAPVECPGLFANLDFWSSGPAGFDFSGARSLAVNNSYDVILPECSILGDPAQVASIDLRRGASGQIQADALLRIGRPGTLHGLGGWFAAELSPGVRITNSPLSGRRIRRRQIYFPIDRPAAVSEGDIVSVGMIIRPVESIVSWTVEVSREGSRMASFRHSTWEGMLVRGEDLAATRPDSVPRLTARGEARRTALNLCDGALSLGEIEREVYRRHPNLFASRKDAAAFVAEVVTRYGEPR
jgi:protein arginine N-methyltransferase 1